ncbi:hypothetical protein NW765_002736 [Fusarium oxysporum]|nr:hypothetical protein FOWG_00849 [Fusarium oxysporum f. sp. lycopersici MN25]KAJ4138841.1 hypothetical protein NW765_002736 [Fusarium oxysporum]
MASYRHPSRPVPTISPTSEAGADASKKKKSCRLVSGTITIISEWSGWGKTNKKNKKKAQKKANEKVADKVTEKVEVMQLG